MHSVLNDDNDGGGERDGGDDGDSGGGDGDNEGDDCVDGDEDNILLRITIMIKNIIDNNTNNNDKNCYLIMNNNDHNNSNDIGNNCRDPLLNVRCTADFLVKSTRIHLISFLLLAEFSIIVLCVHYDCLSVAHL